MTVMKLGDLLSYLEDVKKAEASKSFRELHDNGVEIYHGCYYYVPTYDYYVDKTYMPETEIWH